jgi:hypothetical protein
MRIPTDATTPVVAEHLRAYVQKTVKHIPCKLPVVVTVYFDQNMCMVGFSSAIWADQATPLCVARIDYLMHDDIRIAYTMDGMIAQGEDVRAYLLATYGVLIHKTLFVRQKELCDESL